MSPTRRDVAKAVVAMVVAGKASLSKLESEAAEPSGDFEETAYANGTMMLVINYATPSKRTIVTSRIEIHTFDDGTGELVLTTFGDNRAFETDILGKRSMVLDRAHAAAFFAIVTNEEEGVK